MLTKDELETRNLVSHSTAILNHAAYRHLEDKPLPNEGTHVVEGNVILFVKKVGNGPVPNDIFMNKQNVIGKETNPHESLRFLQGPLYFIDRKIYEMTDSELCWRY